jgi:hypothetical protein
VALPLYRSPVVFTSSRVEQSEATCVGVAVEALLRSAGHPNQNSTISVLSSDSDRESDRDSAVPVPSDDQWDDEFLKVKPI